MRRKKLIHSKF